MRAGDPGAAERERVQTAEGVCPALRWEEVNKSALWSPGGTRRSVCSRIPVSLFPLGFLHSEAGSLLLEVNGIPENTSRGTWSLGKWLPLVIGSLQPW